MEEVADKEDSEEVGEADNTEADQVSAADCSTQPNFPVSLISYPQLPVD